MKNIVQIIGWALLYFIIELLCNISGLLHPFCWVYQAIPCAILAAWPFARLTKNHTTPGLLVVVAMIWIALNRLIGEGDGLYIIIGVAIAVVSELIRLAYGCKSYDARIMSYMAFSLLPFSNPLRIWIKFEETMEHVTEEMGEVYVSKMLDVCTPSMLVAMIVMTLALAYVSFRFFENKEN